MRWDKAYLLALPALALAHNSHHAHHESFSQERLDELEQKWGTDVIILHTLYGWQLTST